MANISVVSLGSGGGIKIKCLLRNWLQKTGRGRVINWGLEKNQAEYIFTNNSEIINFQVHNGSGYHVL